MVDVPAGTLQNCVPLHGGSKTMWAFAICIFQASYDEKNVATFSVELTAFEGLNATIGRTVSP